MSEDPKSVDVYVRNWSKFQHYSHRNPPWIKLHRELLTDPRWAEISDFDARLLVNIWMLAAGQEKDGYAGDCYHIAFNVRADASKVLASVQVLEAQDFVKLASAVLAPCLQDARPEREEREKERQNREKEEERAWSDGISDSIWQDLRARGATPAYRKRWAKYLTPTTGPCTKLTEQQRVDVLEDALAATMAESKVGELPSVPFLDSAVSKRAQAAINTRPKASGKVLLR